MRYFLLLSFSILVFTLGCSSTPTQVAQSPQPKATVARKAPVRQVEVTFDTVMVSDDIAKFDFTDASGESITFTILKDNPDTVEIDKELLDTPGDPDQLISVKLDWFGEPVILHYDEDGEIVKLSPKKK